MLIVTKDASFANPNLYINILVHTNYHVVSDPVRLGKEYSKMSLVLSGNKLQSLTHSSPYGYENTGDKAKEIPQMYSILLKKTHPKILSPYDYCVNLKKNPHQCL